MKKEKIKNLIAKGKNEEAEIFQIFKDELTIENGLIKGEQMLDEMIIR